MTRTNYRRIPIGVIGTGVAAAHAHLPVVARRDDFDLVSVCDRDSKRAESTARKWNVHHFSSEVSGVLKLPGLEAVIIATPPDSHLQIALECITAGKHVLVEKPLATSVEQCLEITVAANAKGVQVAVNHEKRFHPTFQEVGRLLREGAIGQPYFGGVHWASNAKLAPEAFIPKGFGEGYRWRWSNPQIGGGIVQDHLPHYVDLITHWTDARPTAVYAQTFNVGRDLLSWAPPDSLWEDMGLVLTRFSNDFLLRLETGVVGRSLSPLWLLGSGIGEWTEYGYILGTAGQLLFDLLPWDSSENGRIAIWQLDRAKRERTGWAFVEQPEPARSQGSPAGAAHAMFDAQLSHFARLIRGESSRIATAEDGLLAVAAVEAAYRSAANHAECAIRSTAPAGHSTEGMVHV
ncbi:MAG: Gfo/Idh/MocA family protein [Terriglobales bacterium]